MYFKIAKKNFGAELLTGFGTRSALGVQKGLCSFQWALWQSLPQYLTRLQRAQLDRVGPCRSQWAQAPVSLLGVGFLGGMALGGGEGRGAWETPPATPGYFFFPFSIYVGHLCGGTVVFSSPNFFSTHNRRL